MHFCLLVFFIFLTKTNLSQGELGVAGGEKYLVGTIFFKYALDAYKIYGGDHFAMVCL